ncbi:MAG: TatD family hydrolase [Proteobacteria bacterium]|nr:TatD family hydrolase [Pseudomonadota bacterium]
MLVDSHCHLNYPQLQTNLAAVLERAKVAGVGYMQTICTQLDEFAQVREIAQQHDNIFCSVGLHPLEVAGNGSAAKQQIIDLTTFDKVIGIGETGLDYHYSKDEGEHEAQRKSFVAHIEAAQHTGLPLIIHTREAEEDTIKILSQQLEKAPFTGVMHCFTGSKKLAQKALNMGLYLSASGIITFKNAEDLRQTFFDAPLSRILVETDSPYLAPVPYRGRDNEPAYVKEVAQYLAMTRGIPFEQLASVTTDNFFTLFNRATR